MRWSRPTETRPLRIFVGLTEVAGYYSKVAKGLTDMGCEVTVVFLADPFGYLDRDPRIVPPPKLVMKLLAWTSGERGWLSRSIAAVGRLMLFAWTLFRCDAYIFAAGTSFFRGLDYRVLRLAGKRTIAVFNGSDARPPYLSGLEWVGKDDADMDGVRHRSGKTAAHVRRVERGASAIISHPGFSQFQSRRFYSYLAIGVPVPAMPPRTLQVDVEALIVLHAPTRPLHKGTPEIEAALDVLRSEGLGFDYQVLMGLQNADVLHALQSSDLVVDEIHGDTLLGGLGVEGAAAGCAVVVAGYAGRVIEQTHSCPLPPVQLIDPDDLLDTLRTKLANAERTRQEGRELREFVETYWSAKAVASRMIAIIDGSADPTWTIDPLEVVYVEGWGVDREVLRDRLKGYLAAHGPDGLFVDDHSTLRAALMEFAEQ